MKGEVIKRWRFSAGMTQTDLAIKAGTSLSTIQKIEANKYDPPRTTVRALCEAMHHTLDEYDVAAGGMLDLVVSYAEKLSTTAQLHLAHELADREIFAAPRQPRRNISSESGGEADLPSYSEIRVSAATTLLRLLDSSELRVVGEGIPLTVAKVILDAASESSLGDDAAPGGTPAKLPPKPGQGGGAADTMKSKAALGSSNVGDQIGPGTGGKKNRRGGK